MDISLTQNLFSSKAFPYTHEYLHHFLRQEVDGLQVRHLQLASCLHFIGQEKVGFRVDAYN